MPGSLPADHFCAWRDEAERLSSELATLRGDLDALKRHVYGRRSEKMPSLEREVRGGESADPTITRARRAAAKTAKAALPTDRIEHRVPTMERTCPTCVRLAEPAGTKETVTYSFVTAHVRRRVHVRETLACRCGYIISAPAPDRVFDRTPYEASRVAHLIVSKCADSMPLYRLAKQFARTGMPLGRSTMSDLFQRAGERLTPLADRILTRIAAQDVVLADETTLREQRGAKRTWLWTFVAGGLIGYVYSADRSGETPVRVLGGTTGTLVVDAYTGYNAVTTPAGRTRAGCFAHARWKFFDALPTAPEAQIALDAIRDIYRVEHDATKAGVVRTAVHRAMRQERTRGILDKLHQWLCEQRSQHLPKGPMGVAIRYALGHWAALTRFVDDERLPPDNNRSEAALRIVAVTVSLCTLSSSAWNHKSPIVREITTRAPRLFAACA